MRCPPQHRIYTAIIKKWDQVYIRAFCNNYLNYLSKSGGNVLCSKAVLIQNPWENSLMELLRNVNRQIILINPFIDIDMTQKICDNLKGKKLKILLKADNFDNIKGAQVLELLDSYGAEIRSINNLNARMLIFDSDKVLFTSSSLTRTSLNSNLESGILLEDEKFVASEILPAARRYWDVGDVISSSTIIDISRSLKLSTHEKYREIAGKLMANNGLSREEILGIVHEYFPNKGNIYPVFSGGLSYSFRSEEPFINTGIYLKNVSKIYPNFTKSIFYKTGASMFKNIILEKKEHAVKIRNIDEYHKVQSDFTENFHIKPPKSTNIFNAIIEDGYCIQKIMEYPEYYTRVKNIFPAFKKELQMVILRNYEGEIRRLEGKIQPEVKDEVIREIQKNMRRIRVKMDIVRES